MSRLTISNLDEGSDLDRREGETVVGGLQVPGLGYLPLYGVTNVLASVNSATISQNAVNFVMGGGGGAGDTVNHVGTASITPVNVSSPVTVVQGGLPSV